MTGIPTLRPEITTLATLRRHHRFGLARLKADPNAASLVADFQAFSPIWAAANQKEMDLDDAVTDAEAQVVTADNGLDGLADRISLAIHGTKKVNVEAPLHQLFFGSETVSKFKRPLLSKELDAAQSWPALLTQVTEAALKALATDAGPILQSANAAAKSLDDAIKARDAWKLGGDKQKVYDSFNSACAKAHGALKSFGHDHPELHLPNDYADTFFLHDTSSPHGTTVNETAKAAAKADQKATAAKAKHDAALAKAAAKAAAAADRQKKKDAAAAAKAVAKDAAKKAKEAVAAAKKK